VALGEVLTFFGMVADNAAGNEPGEGQRVAALAVAMAKIAGLSQSEIDALYFAARLRNAGAIGDAALSNSRDVPERERAMQRWEIPAAGARLCERIAALPPGTADIVRWQAECWDGTGYPDQLRWSGIPAPAQLLHIAAFYTGIAEPEEALNAIALESGRRFAPEHTRTFAAWYHRAAGKIEPIAPPYQALAADRTTRNEILELFK
jgi:putative two-component system response regulator